MAVCADKRLQLQNQIDEAEATVMSLGEDAAGEKAQLQAQLQQLHNALQDEEERRQRWAVRHLPAPAAAAAASLNELRRLPSPSPLTPHRPAPVVLPKVENLRRKHNFIPLFLELLRELARCAHWQPQASRGTCRRAASWTLSPLAPQEKPAQGTRRGGQAQGGREDEGSHGGGQEEACGRSVDSRCGCLNDRAITLLTTETCGTLGCTATDGRAGRGPSVLRRQCRTVRPAAAESLAGNAPDSSGAARPEEEAGERGNVKHGRGSSEKGDSGPKPSLRTTLEKKTVLSPPKEKPCVAT